MNAYIARYLKQAQVCFPIVGKPERLFLGQLAQSIQDYFFRTDPQSLEDIIQVFGLPQLAVRAYLAHADIQQIARRVRVRRLIRLCGVTILGLCLMAALLAALHFGLTLKILHETEEFMLPVYSATGTILK